MFVTGWLATKAAKYGMTKAGEHMVKQAVRKKANQGTRKVKEVLAGYAGVEMPDAVPEKNMTEKLTEGTVGRLSNWIKDLERTGKGEAAEPEVVVSVVPEPKLKELAVLSGKKLTGDVKGAAGGFRNAATSLVKKLEAEGKAAPKSASNSNTPIKK